MSRTLRAFLDASVLYPASLRSLLMRLTLGGLYQARWSADVHDEWIRAVARDNPGVPVARLQALRAQTPDEFIRHLLDLAPAL